MTEPPQDTDVAEPRIPLGTFLALARVLAGRRGDATIEWRRQGFNYTLIVERSSTTDPGVAVDADPTALGGNQAREQILDALQD